MSTSSDSQSSTSESESSWWSPSSWVPDPTPLTPSSTSWFPATSESDSATWSRWTWTETALPTAARVTGVGPPTFTPSSPPSLLFSSTSLIETQTSQTDSTGHNPKGTAVKLRTGHIVAIYIVTFIVLLAMASLVYLLIRLRIRKPSHQRLYSDPEEKFGDDDSSTMVFINTTGRNGGGEAFDFGATIGAKDGEGSLRERMPLDRWYYNERRSLSDSEAGSILQPPFGWSDSPVSSTERETYSFGLGLNDVHEPSTIQSESSGLFVGAGPSSPSDPPRYSKLLPMQSNLRPPRPLPVPKNPRALVPHRRVDSIQVRMQNKPPLISSSTTSLASPPTSSSFLSSTGLHNSAQGPGAIPEKFPPLLPQRRTEQSTQVSPSSWASKPSLSPLAPLRLTPSAPSNHTKHETNISTNQTNQTTTSSK